MPRLTNRIRDGVLAKVAKAGGLKAKLFHLALSTKLANLRRGYSTHRLWDALVFNKVAKEAGLDRTRIIVTGSAPIAGHVMDFFRVLFPKSLVLEGYGQTETAAAATVCHKNDLSTEHVGGPIGCNEIKLVSVPDMGYLVTDAEHRTREGERGMPCLGRGEIWIRGSNTFMRYFRMPEETKATITPDGWVRSGDIGIWTATGCIKIVDRKKSLLKLSQGEYVSPEKIENLLLQSAFVEQVFVHGDSTQSVLVGVVKPKEPALMAWAQANGVAGAFADVCKSAAARKMVLADLDEVGGRVKLMGFEKLKALYLESELFSPDNGLLTPTFKLKRKEARDKYREAIDDMYRVVGH